MNIEEAKIILNWQLKCANKENKAALNLFDKEAIKTLLTAYEKEKEKNKELQNRVDYLSKISGLLSTDTIIGEE